MSCSLKPRTDSSIHLKRLEIDRPNWVSLPRRTRGLKEVSSESIIGVFGDSPKFSEFTSRWRPKELFPKHFNEILDLLRSRPYQVLAHDGLVPEVIQVRDSFYVGESGFYLAAASKIFGVSVRALVTELLLGNFPKMQEVLKARMESEIIIGGSRVKTPKNRWGHLQPKEGEFVLPESTVWSFPSRGAWATHDGSYRGNFSPHMIRSLLLLYTQEGEVVLDPMVGGGTTLIECALLNRLGIGIDLNPDAISITRERLRFVHEAKQRTFTGDARNLNLVENESVDFAMVHPPYGDIIKYSNCKGDLSSHSKLKVNLFVEEMIRVAYEVFRSLKQGKFCALLIADIRDKCRQIPLSDMLREAFMRVGFVLRNDIIKVQHNCKDPGTGVSGRMTGLTRKLSNGGKSYLPIKHEHLYVLEKPENGMDLSAVRFSTCQKPSVRNWYGEPKKKRGSHTSNIV